MKKSSKELLGKMHGVLEGIETILRDNTLTAETQIADVDAFCWALIELTVNFRQTTEEDLSDLE